MQSASFFTNAFRWMGIPHTECYRLVKEEALLSCKELEGSLHE